MVSQACITGNCTVTITSARYCTVPETVEVDAHDVDDELWFSQRCHITHSS
jgi:hypothetical protein